MTTDDKNPKKPVQTTTHKRDEQHSQQSGEHIDRTRTVTRTQTNYIGPWHTEVNATVDKTVTQDRSDSRWTSSEQHHSTDVVITSPAKVKHRKAAAHHAPAKPLPAPEPRVDALRITSENSKEITDFDVNADARTDAAALHTAVGKLKQALATALPGNAALRINGADDANALAILIQKDYAGQQESSFKLNYTDHLDKSFDESLGNVPITHDNLQKVTVALNKATEAVKGLKTHLAPGQTVTQDAVSTQVRNMLKSELSDVLVR